MKITIDWVEIKTTSTNKEYKAVSFKDESGAEVKASVWSDTPIYAQIAPGAEIEVEVKKSPDGKYTNLVAPNTGSRGAGMQALKTAQIDKAMDKKAQQIAVAQDRSALMWAKYGACEIIAHHPAFKSYVAVEIPELIEKLSTQIYNGELTEPFNS